MTDRPPRFSVVLPTYNRSGIVLEAINSVLYQTFTDFELIVVDDGSTDETASVLSGLSDSRVRVVSNTHKKGGPGARNSGIEEARGEWLCQIDSDDLWQPDMLESLAREIECIPVSVGIVYGSDFHVDARTGAVFHKRVAFRRGYVYPGILEEYFICHSAAAVRMELVRRVGGYDENFSTVEDTDFLHRVTELCEVHPVPAAVYLYRIWGKYSQVSRDHSTYADDCDKLAQKYKGLLRQYPRTRFSIRKEQLLASVKAKRWGRAFIHWLALLPAITYMPRKYLFWQKDAFLTMLHGAR